MANNNTKSKRKHGVTNAASRGHKRSKRFGKVGACKAFQDSIERAKQAIGIANANFENIAP